MAKIESTYAGQRPTSYKINKDKSDEDMADSDFREKATDTSRLGSYKPTKAVVETDPDKMSPLVRAAAMEAEKRRKARGEVATMDIKKRRGVTTDDAAAALGSRR